MVKMCSLCFSAKQALIRRFHAFTGTLNPCSWLMRYIIPHSSLILSKTFDMSISKAQSNFLLVKTFFYFSIMVTRKCWVPCHFLKLLYLFIFHLHIYFLFITFWKIFCTSYNTLTGIKILFFNGLFFVTSYFSYCFRFFQFSCKIVVNNSISDGLS